LNKVDEKHRHQNIKVCIQRWCAIGIGNSYAPNAQIIAEHDAYVKIIILVSILFLLKVDQF